MPSGRFVCHVGVEQGTPLVWQRGALGNGAISLCCLDVSGCLCTLSLRLEVVHWRNQSVLAGCVWLFVLFNFTVYTRHCHG
jgi:hypothetical protein